MPKGMRVRTNWRNMPAVTSKRGSGTSRLGCWSFTRCFFSGRSITAGNIGAVWGQDDQDRTIDGGAIDGFDEFIDPENAERA